MNKKQKMKMIPSKDVGKCFKYAGALALNHKEIAKDSKKPANTKPFINKYDCEGINYPLKKMIGNNLRKITQQIFLNVIC